MFLVSIQETQVSIWATQVSTQETQVSILESGQIVKKGNKIYFFQFYVLTLFFNRLYKCHKQKKENYYEIRRIK